MRRWSTPLAHGTATHPSSWQCQLSSLGVDTLLTDELTPVQVDRAVAAVLVLVGLVALAEHRADSEWEEATPIETH